MMTHKIIISYCHIGSGYVYNDSYCKFAKGPTFVTCVTFGSEAVSEFGLWLAAYLGLDLGFYLGYC